MTPNIDAMEKMKIIGARIREGRDSYAGRLDAWHNLGIVSGKFQTWRELLASAKADFGVVKMQLSLGGTPVQAYGTFRVDKAVPQGITPTTQVALPDGTLYYLTFLGPVGKDYEVINHTEGFGVLDELIGSIDGAHFETMGTLDFGRIVWGQANINTTIRVGDDVSSVLLSFHTSHDGSRAWDVYETGTRIVCRNTFRMGSLQRLAATLRVRHTKNAQNRINDLKTEIDDIKRVALSMQDRLTWLSQKKVTKPNLETIMKKLFPMTKNDDGVEQSSSRRDNILAGASQEPPELPRLTVGNTFTCYGNLGTHLECAMQAYRKIPSSSQQGCTDELKELVKRCEAAIKCATRLLEGNR